jgi:hypothetical protein
MGVTASPAFILSMPTGLAVIYGLAALIWYELLRSAVRGRIARRRGRKARIAQFQSDRREEAELRERDRDVVEREAVEASEPDLARRLFYLARKAAEAERDLAIQKANEAAAQAVDRIERRYREIDAELEREEAERLNTR